MTIKAQGNTIGKYTNDRIEDETGLESKRNETKAYVTTRRSTMNELKTKQNAYLPRITS